MAKSFGRPATIDLAPRRAGETVVVRDIHLPREGHALEGAYAAASARNELETAPYEALSKQSFNHALIWWICVSLFWIGLAWAFMNGY
jgi:hypothetical protein